MPVEVLPDPDAVADRAAKLLIDAAADAVRQRGRFTLALSGGSTPERLYRRLASPEMIGQVDWMRTVVFLGDDRFVPPDDPRSNYGLARRTLLDHVPVDPGRVFAPFHGPPGPAAVTGEGTIDEAAVWPEPGPAARDYASALARAFGVPADGPPPRFDLVLLGLGDDGHTASLFPGKPAATERTAWAVASPPGRLPPPVDRVTLTLPVLNAARRVLFLVAGADKAATVRDVLNGADLPASAVRPTDGELVWLLDAAAARNLDPARRLHHADP